MKLRFWALPAVLLFLLVLGGYHLLYEWLAEDTSL
jgi:hypothetical protein